VKTSVSISINGVKHTTRSSHDCSSFTSSRAGRPHRQRTWAATRAVRRLYHPPQRPGGEVLHHARRAGEGAQIKTIEGMATDGKLNPIQDGFWEKHGLQCGFCTRA